MAKLIDARLVISQRDLKKAMLPAIAEKFNELFRAKFSTLYSKSADIIEEEIQNHPVYESIISQNPHELGSQLGIENALDKIYHILSIWRNSLRVNMIEVKAAGTRLRGGIEITAVNADYEEVLNIPEAHHIAERALLRGIDPYNIEWLRWLLEEGTNPLVYYYYYDTELTERDNSRTGLSVMRHDMSEVWRVPGQYAGTRGDNFITQAMEKAARRIQELIIAEIDF